MKLRDTLICWTAAWVPGMRPEARDTPGVKIGPYPANGWDREWQRSDGACWVDWRGRSAAATSSGPVHGPNDP